MPGASKGAARGAGNDNGALERMLCAGRRHERGWTLVAPWAAGLAPEEQEDGRDERGPEELFGGGAHGHTSRCRHQRGIASVPSARRRTIAAKASAGTPCVCRA